MVTFEKFREDILKDVENCPKEWRKGQAVFNILDELGLARIVQFQDNIDCFYNDNNIEAFMFNAYKHWVEYQQANTK